MRLTSNRFFPEIVLEIQCCLCGTQELGDAVTYEHPSGFPSIYCGDCRSEAVPFCGECHNELEEGNIGDVFEVPDHFNLEEIRTHLDALCNDCHDATVSGGDD